MINYLFSQRTKEMSWFKMSMKFKDFRWKKVICEKMTVGEVKEIIIDSSNWRITHLLVELSKDAAELALGIKKGGIRNLLATSAIGKINKNIALKVKKGQLHIYLKAPKIK
jgi:sporulation protein YlmC with PRC-barrel domain